MYFRWINSHILVVDSIHGFCFGISSVQLIWHVKSRGERVCVCFCAHRFPMMAPLLSFQRKPPSLGLNELIQHNQPVSAQQKSQFFLSKKIKYANRNMKIGAFHSCTCNEHIFLALPFCISFPLSRSLWRSDHISKLKCMPMNMHKLTTNGHNTMASAIATVHRVGSQILSFLKKNRLNASSMEVQRTRTRAHVCNESRLFG